MNLTSRELAVMQLLWDAGEPLTVAEIVGREENGTIDSVQRITKSLLKKNLIAIEGYQHLLYYRSIAAHRPLTEVMERA